jgi:CDP-2,3-bis-(O-geranylgeranyl)-sn-glycerol synthase
VVEALAIAVWYMLPAGAGNMTPVLVAKVPLLRDWRWPLDFGKSYRGKRIFGANKTWRGLITGVMAGVLVGYLQSRLYAHTSLTLPSSLYGTAGAMLLGGLLAFGALAGDFIESFVKRQVGVNAGDSWFPFDQIDYIVGACLLGALLYVLTPLEYAAIALIWFGLHLSSSYLGFLMGFKKKPI